MKKYLLLILAVTGLFVLAPTQADAGFVFVGGPVYYGGSYWPAHYGPYWYGRSSGRPYGWHRQYWDWVIGMVVTGTVGTGIAGGAVIIGMAVGIIS